jgi:hypothetical protein
MISSLARRAGAAAAILAASLASAAAQYPAPPAGVSGGAPPAGGRNPVCVRLESQLAAFDQGAVDPARADQIKRYEDQVAKQQAELDRTLAQSRKIGCEGGGFFALFSGQPAQCGELNSRITQMRANLDRMLSDLQQLQTGGNRNSQRQMLIQALAQNDCGPQYRQAATQPRGFFETLFGPGEGPGPDVGPNATPSSSTYRTLCVRSCDGYYYPISFAAVPGKFPEDERICQKTCPAAEAQLFVYHNPGEDVSQAVSLTGKRYTDLPNAFRYRKEYTSACSCRAAGQTWAEALKNADDSTTLERGDIVVTEESAKRLSLPTQDAQGRPIKRDARAAKPQAAAGPAQGAAPAPAAPAASTDPGAASDSGQRSIRSVGPTFIPPR